jgi:hypothetical protein
LPDTSNNPAAGPLTLVLRAVFVREGEQPPPEFLSDFGPLRMPATLDPATGEITCDNSGTSFDGEVRAEWHPDSDGEDGDDSSGDEKAKGTGGPT